jgi:ubiquitin-like domain-containing CTD phosphatase 1
MIGGPWNYEISFVLDKTLMFTVFSERGGEKKETWQHSVKALKIIWNHLPQLYVLTPHVTLRIDIPYSNKSNTIHVDDLSRNFALNPHNGLKISAFKNAGSPTALADRELELLGRYMVWLANSGRDFDTVPFKVCFFLF